MSLNNKTCMFTPTVIELNPVELNYYLLMINPDKFNGSCTVPDDSSTKLCVAGESKTLNVKVSNIITKI